MKPSMWDILFNLLLLALWMREWSYRERQTLFNPYLETVKRSSDAVLEPMRAALGLNRMRVVLLITAVILLAMRALLVLNDSSWLTGIGREIIKPHTADFMPAFILSIFSFAMFLFNLWGMSLIYCRGSEHNVGAHPVEALFFAAKPFTAIPANLRPAALLLYGVLLGAAIHFFPDSVGTVRPGFSGLSSMIPRLIISALIGWTMMLSILLNLLFAFIILSWVSMFTGSMNLAMFTRDWIDAIIGPFRHNRFRIGMLDLTAIIFFIAVGFIQQILINILLRSYQSFL